MTTAVFQKRRGALVPVDDEGRQIMSGIANGRDVLVEVKNARNPRQHRLLFAMLNFCLQHSIIPDTGEVRFDNIKQVLLALKVATGEVDTYIDADNGRAFFIPRSISFASMDQSAFNDFFDRAIYVIAERWMPYGTTETAVRTEILMMIDPSVAPSITPSQGHDATTREREPA